MTRSVIITTFHCRACDHELGYLARHYSNGVCPICSQMGNAGAVVDCYTRTSRKVVLRPWWKVWAGRRSVTEAVE
jgi:hypothetical protein